jgi:hypothetical protein
VGVSVSMTSNDDGQLVDETKMMRSRWNEEVEITMQGECLPARCSVPSPMTIELAGETDDEQVLVMG